MREIDLLVIGGGSAGMAAAIEAKKNGIDNILILEKESFLGGILNQCIHSGFGLTEFKEELTGPEYMKRFVDQVNELGIEYKLNALVIDFKPNKMVTYSSKDDGIVTLKCKAVVVSTGCFERSAGMINLPGDRCSGIMSAGQAQKYMNLYGCSIGHKVVILGSGDIGLIMARRLTLEGVKVECVSEIMPYSNGLARNIAQCLNDFNIPLYLSHTVSNVIGKDRVEKVVLSKVDEKMQIIPGTEMEIECDTLILSVGLMPYLGLLMNAGPGLAFDKGKIIVDEYLQCSYPGVFLCGNSLHVHDVVDFVTEEGRLAGYGASLFIKDELQQSEMINTVAKQGINYIVPQRIHAEANDDVTLKLRVMTPVKDAYIKVINNGNIIFKKYFVAMYPSEMVQLKLNRDILKSIKGDLEVILEKKED